jgi:hypothetical protein
VLRPFFTLLSCCDTLSEIPYTLYTIARSDAPQYITNMSAYTIPRKEVGAPAPAHVKEVDNTSSADAHWDTEVPSKKKHNILGTGAGATGWALSDRFDRVLPPHKRYFGRSRRTFLIIILVAFLCLLALIIGLAVGLGGGSKKYD